MAKKDDKKKKAGATAKAARKPNVKRVSERKAAAKTRKAGTKTAAGRGVYSKSNRGGITRKR